MVFVIKCLSDDMAAFSYPYVGSLWKSFAFHSEFILILYLLDNIQKILCHLGMKSHTYASFGNHHFFTISCQNLAIFEEVLNNFDRSTDDMSPVYVVLVSLLVNQLSGLFLTFFGRPKKYLFSLREFLVSL